MAHGSKSRARTKERRLKEKRARKASMQALYDSRKNTGANKKSKRFLSHMKGSNRKTTARILIEVPALIKGVVGKVFRKAHGGPECGNVGCKRCSLVARKVLV